MFFKSAPYSPCLSSGKLNTFKDLEYPLVTSRSLRSSWCSPAFLCGGVSFLSAGCATRCGRPKRSGQAPRTCLGLVCLSLSQAAAALLKAARWSVVINMQEQTANQTLVAREGEEVDNMDQEGGGGREAYRKRDCAAKPRQRGHLIQWTEMRSLIQ